MCGSWQRPVRRGNTGQVSGHTEGLWERKQRARGTEARNLGFAGAFETDTLWGGLLLSDTGRILRAALCSSPGWVLPRSGTPVLDVRSATHTDTPCLSHPPEPSTG